MALTQEEYELSVSRAIEKWKESGYSSPLKAIENQYYLFSYPDYKLGFLVNGCPDGIRVARSIGSGPTSSFEKIITWEEVKEYLLQPTLF
ncbi:hypothetical protein SAMN06265827_10589 [Orenia metallireducens]|uniref:Uncharacterized protein n=1 Tax=Orenia metallireducens TaxID=1413210 RepID=A0A285G6U9_9FIRM|nr:hypothetical protein [Orenia metallireducens]SNY19259.1 hypothetical protein SAMN06265827_10589 [Orenia metallireducens]